MPFEIGTWLNRNAISPECAARGSSESLPLYQPCITHPCGAVLEYLSWSRLELASTRGNLNREGLTILAMGARRLCAQRDSSMSIDRLAVVVSDVDLAGEMVTSVVRVHR